MVSKSYYLKDKRHHKLQFL